MTLPYPCKAVPMALVILEYRTLFSFMTFTPHNFRCCFYLTFMQNFFFFFGCRWKWNHSSRHIYLAISFQFQSNKCIQLRAIGFRKQHHTIHYQFLALIHAIGRIFTRNFWDKKATALEVTKLDQCIVQKTYPSFILAIEQRIIQLNKRSFITQPK